MAGKKGAVSFNGSSWSHPIKVLQEDGSTKYLKRAGFKTKEEAETSCQNYEEQYAESVKAYQLNHVVDRDIGTIEYLKYWFEDIFSLRVQSSTRMVEAYVLYDLILPVFEQDVKLQLFNSEFVDALLHRVSAICESAGNKSREFLNMAMKEAVVQGYIDKNPITASISYPRKQPSVTILGKERIKEFLSVAQHNYWYLEILLALFCGLRKGEIQGLKFSDFDMEQETVSIERQITSNPIIPKGQSKILKYRIVEKPPKTPNSFRVIHVPKPILEEVRQRKNKQESLKRELGEEYIDNDYVSCQENGIPHSVTAFNTALTKLCKRNGFPHITVHGLRHMYATILLEQKVSIKKISALLGHASVHTTFEYYCDQMDENEKIIGFMNDVFIVGGSDKSD